MSQKLAEVYRFHTYRESHVFLCLLGPAERVRLR